MSSLDVIARGRESFARRAWRDAYASLSTADRASPLAPDDLECLAVAAYLSGHVAECINAWARAHHAFLGRSEWTRAARCAAWIAVDRLGSGQLAQGSGWLARVRRALGSAPPDCSEQGLERLAAGLLALIQGDLAPAHDGFAEAAAIGDRFGDHDLASLARMGQGRTLIFQGEVERGLALLDEVMVVITTAEISPIVIGTVYCSVIEACQGIYDLRRARAWTAALDRWSAEQPELVPFRGQCLLHRAEILQIGGDWTEAQAEAQRAGDWLAGPPPDPATGAAFYRLAELHRLRGESVEAEHAYREASRWGRRPEPGLALLRLAQGRRDAATAMIARAVGEIGGHPERAELLAACVEIKLATGDPAAAHAAADELAACAAEFEAPYVNALAAQAMGAVLLHDGDAAAALGPLRRAWSSWQALDAPHDAARVRVLVGCACRELGDDDTAEMEFDAARWVFRQLGAGPDLARVDELSRRIPVRAAGTLTAREVEVLRLVATGQTNRAIAAELFISEKTVASHVSNIFGKLNLTSRAAATAYAYEHDLI